MECNCTLCDMDARDDHDKRYELMTGKWRTISHTHFGDLEDFLYEIDATYSPKRRMECCNQQKSFDRTAVIRTEAARILYTMCFLTLDTATIIDVSQLRESIWTDAEKDGIDALIAAGTVVLDDEDRPTAQRIVSRVQTNILDVNETGYLIARIAAAAELSAQDGYFVSRDRETIDVYCILEADVADHPDSPSGKRGCGGTLTTGSGPSSWDSRQCPPSR